jgi:hypothetical protein
MLRKFVKGRAFTANRLGASPPSKTARGRTRGTTTRAALASLVGRHRDSSAPAHTGGGSVVALSIP